MTKLPRFRFSLATLLLVVSWAAVAVWVNTKGQVEANGGLISPVGHDYGWPWAYGSSGPSNDLWGYGVSGGFSGGVSGGMHGEFSGMSSGGMSGCWSGGMPPAVLQNQEESPMRIVSYWALVGDSTVGVLLVIALTWASGFLVRRAIHVFRRVEPPPPAARSSP